VLESRKRSVTVRGITLSYIDWGENGPPLLLLHGDMRTARSWDAVARELHPRFHVLSLDARGHGDSDWTPRGYTTDDKVEDLAGFLQELGVREIVGVGHSSGASVLAFEVRREPGVFTRLVLLEPIVVLDETWQRRFASRAGLPRRTWASRRELHRYLEGHETARRWRADVLRDIVEHETLELPDGSIDMKWAAATFNPEDRLGDHYDLRPLFRDPVVPTLFVASQDRRPDFEGIVSIADETPDFHTLIMSESGHNMYMERPDAVARAVEAFANGETLPPVI
jgi:pimeloyl-ACP methyl ester carboxylesterase